MASGGNNFGEHSLGSRAKFWSPKDKSFFEGVVSVNGKNMVVYTSRVEETLKLKREFGPQIKDGIADQGTEAHETAHKINEKDAMKDYGEQFVGLSVNVLRTKAKMVSEGFVASYDSSSGLHLVVFSDGSKEKLFLMGNNQEPAESTTPLQPHKTPRDASYMGFEDDADGYQHTVKKLKVQSSGLRTPSPSPVLVKDLKVPKLEFDDKAEGSPANSKLFVITADDGLADVNGYKVKHSYARLLEAIFAKYGDITVRCLYKSASVRASLLEVICSIVQKLQSYDLDAVLSALETMENEIADVEASRISVSWLQEHLAKVRRVGALREKSLLLKRTKGRSGMLALAAVKEMKQRQAELVLAQERFREAERRAGALRIVCRKIEGDNEECEAEECYWRRRMDDDLL